MRLLPSLFAMLVVVAVIPATGAAAAAATTQEDCSFPYSKTDATGTEVTVDAEPERVVALAPSTAQIMWEIGAESKVVGLPVGPYTSYLDDSAERTNVWNQDGSVNQEAVVSLEPDVVLAANLIPNSTVEDLRNAGLTVYKTPMEDSLAAIPAKVSTYGHFVGACDGAAQTNQEFNASIEEVRATAEDGPNPRVLYYFFNFTAGNETFIGEAIATAGGENVAANAGIRTYGQVNDEIVAEQNPVWIVTPAGATVPDREPYSSTIAVRNNQTLTVNSNYISQPAPRVVIPMMKMAEAFQDTQTPTPTPTVTPQQTEMATAQPTDSPTPTTTATGEPTETGSPGFSLATALAALVALLGLLLARGG